MRIALLFTLLLAVAPLAHGQQSVPLVEPRAQVVQPQAAPLAQQVAPARLDEQPAAVQEMVAAQREGPSRTVWFLIGALTVAAILLVVLL